MRFGICTVLLALVCLGAQKSFAELSLFTLPSAGRSWQEAKQSPLSETRFIEVIDFQRIPGGIVPIEPVHLVPVPDIALDLKAGEVTAGIDSMLLTFSVNVAQRDVVALRDVVLEDRTVVRAGDVLIPRWTSFPRRLEEVQLLRRAGVTEAHAMINVAESFPRPPVANKYNKGLNLTWLGVFEQAMTKQRLQEGLSRVFDNDPLTFFERIDRVGQDVKQKWILYIDLGRFFPIRLIRLYPSPLQPVRLSAYTIFRGLPGTEKQIAGLSLDDPKVGQLAFPEFNNIAPTFPTFVPEQSVPVNVLDTIAVLFDPPGKMRYARIDFQTELDYSLGEMEFLADGFVPEATYTTRALSLSPATLGRIFWDEVKIGDPTQSSVTVRLQTGVNSEPELVFRVNEFEREVEWKPDTSSDTVKVVDRRPGSATFGQLINLNSPQFNLDAREIFSALRPEERQSIRLTREEYKALPGNLRRRVEPDLEFWSGFQNATSGQLINAPSGRPFIQLQLEFKSSAPEAATAISNLRFEFSAPQIIQSLTGEIAPAVDVIAGRDTSFVMALRASLQSTNNGFNRLQVFTPARVTRVEGLELEVDGQKQVLGRVGLDDEPALPGEGQFKEVFIDDKQFVVAFPAVKPGAQGTERNVLVRLRFRARVIDFRTNFRANAFLDTLGAGTVRQFTSNGILALDGEGATADTLALFLPQSIQERNIVDFEQTDQLSDRNSLAVIADISQQSKELVTNFNAVPNPFTPNGDGLNDQLNITFDVQRLLTPRPLRIEIYDLSGRRLQQIERNIDSGGYSQVWDGNDGEGKRVPPGLYVLRISTDADKSGEAVTRLISVVY